MGALSRPLSVGAETRTATAVPPHPIRDLFALKPADGRTC